MEKKEDLKPSNFEISINTNFLILESNENNIKSKIIVLIDRQIEIGMHHDCMTDRDDIIPDIYLAINTKDKKDYEIQKDGNIFTIIKFPGLKNWYFDTYDCIFTNTYNETFFS